VSSPSERRQRRSSAYDGPLLDEIDRRILTELQDDGRVTMAELGRRVNLSAPAVGERVQRMEETGVITGYAAQVDH
jgi:Lrp/AsnC family leucine-responsive transcriptional regulator